MTLVTTKIGTKQCTDSRATIFIASETLARCRRCGTRPCELAMTGLACPADVGLSAAALLASTSRLLAIVLTWKKKSVSALLPKFCAKSISQFISQFTLHFLSAAIPQRPARLRRYCLFCRRIPPFFLLPRSKPSLSR